MDQNQSAKNAFNSIYEAESDPVFRFCYFKVSSREQALDLTQEVFVRLWQTLQSGKEMSNPRAFVFVVARRLVIDWYRKKKSVSLEALSESDDSSYETFEVSDEKTNLDRELEVEGRFVKEKIGQLATRYREPIYLRFIEGLLPEEIAVILGTSVNATSVRIHRGIKELRKLTGYSEG